MRQRQSLNTVEIIVRQVVQLVENSVSVPVCIFSLDGDLIAHTGTSLPEEWVNIIERLKNHIQEYRNAEVSLVYIHESVLGDEAVCYIVVPMTKGLEFASYVETLIFSKYTSFHNKKISFENPKRGLLANQLAGAREIDAEIESYFQDLKCSKDIPRCAILLSIMQEDDSRENPSAASFVSVVEQWRYDTQLFTQEDIYGLVGDGITVFKAVSSLDFNEYYKDVETMVDSLIQYAAEFLDPGVHIYACAGSAYGSAAMLHRSYEEANYLFSKTGSKERYKDKCCFINDYVFEYLYARMNSSVQEHMIKDLKIALERDPTIAETAVAVSENNIRPNDSAKSLGIHKNTMHQRLQKMKNSMALDPLYNTRDRAALKIYSAQKNRKIVWNAGTMIQPGNVLHMGLQHLSELLYKRSGGTFQINIHTVATTGDNYRLFTLLKEGSLDMVVGSTFSLSQLAGLKISVLQLPFLFESEEEAKFVLQTVVLPELKSSLSEVGILCFSIWSQGWRYLTSKGTPIRIPDDLRGRKLRILNSDEIKEYFTSIGAEIVQIYYNNIREALASNIIECQENPYVNILAMKFYSYQEFITELEMFYSLEALCVSQSSWQKLDEQKRRLLRDVIREGSEWMLQTQKEQNLWAKQELVKKGMKIIELTEEEKRLWRESVSPVYEHTKYKDFLKRIYDAEFQYRKHGSNFSDDFIF